MEVVLAQVERRSHDVTAVASGDAPAASVESSASRSSTDLYAPVCGCEGVTCGNECERRQHAVQQDHDGECRPARCVTACGCYAALGTSFHDVCLLAWGVGNAWMAPASSGAGTPECDKLPRRPRPLTLREASRRGPKARQDRAGLLESPPCNGGS